jgi:hypothetical protein
MVARWRTHEGRAHAALALGVGLACTAALAANVAQIANDLAFDRRYWHLNADVDGNSFSWASALATAAVGAFAISLGRAVPHRRRVLFGVGAVVTFFAIDDVTGWHEDLGGAFELVGLPNVSGVWFPVYMPLFAFVFLVLWSLRSEFERAGAYVRTGLLLLGVALAGEVGAAGFVPGVNRTEHGVLYTLEVGIEEGAELAGWILIAAGLAAAVECARAHVERVPEGLPVPTH